VLASVPWLISYYFVGVGGHDDSHITFYVARQLSTAGEYVNYNHETVEQSSSMGLVLILAALRLITGVSLPLLGYLVSMVGGSAAVGLTYALGKRLPKGSEEERARTALLAAATSATTWCFLYWSTSAMEASLAAAAAPALVVAMARYEEQPKRGSRLRCCCSSRFAPRTSSSPSVRPSLWASCSCGSRSIGGGGLPFGLQVRLRR
jgi:4-amino-4-deoxy-L-arabinose transferase-like glycosyltransferase